MALLVNPRSPALAEPATKGVQAAARTLRTAFRTPTLRPKSPRRGEVIEFLAQMPTDTKIFLTMAVLGLVAMMIVLRRLI
jgi:hypothetical protein